MNMRLLIYILYLYKEDSTDSVYWVACIPGCSNQRPWSHLTDEYFFNITELHKMLVAFMKQLNK